MRRSDFVRAVRWVGGWCWCWIAAVCLCAADGVEAQSAYDQLRQLGGNGGPIPEPGAPERVDVDSDDGYSSGGGDSGSNEDGGSRLGLSGLLDRWIGGDASSEPEPEEETEEEPEPEETSEADDMAAEALLLEDAGRKAREAGAYRDKAKAALEERKRELATAQAAASGSQAVVDSLRYDVGAREARFEDARASFEAAWSDTSVVYLDDGALLRPLPGRMVDAQVYERARSDKARLRSLAEKLDERIAALRKWRQAPAGDIRELEKIRAGATWDSLSNLLSAVPVADILKKVKGLDPTKEARLKAQLAALKSIVNSAESVGAPSEKDRAAKLTDAGDGAVEAIREILTLPMPESQRKSLETLQKSITTAAKVGLWAKDLGDGKRETGTVSARRQQFESIGELAVDVAAVWCPPAAVAQGAFGVVEAGFTHVVATRAIRDLQEVQSRNWSAEAHLQRKKAELEATIRELDMSAIAPYEMQQKLGRP